ncbi:MAG: PepSY domain-containing protein [Acinetobacter sp.]|nr:MAG: PepSY domain-containing protein [Acinetobacter sp.]
MRIDGKSEGARQSMSWLHTWISLLLGWLLYAIFLTGTLSFFQNEITVWMKPELHQSLSNVSQQQQLNHTLKYLHATGESAESWNIRFANARQPALSVQARKPGEGRRRGGETYLNTQTGEKLEARETRGGGFLYRFHFELYGMDRIWARWIVSFATMFMFVAIISGIITHKKIFKDFFTFRPAKGQRSWLDAHNATAVFALPFHIMITFSGLLLLMYMLMPWAMNTAYKDRQDFFAALNPERAAAQATPTQTSQQNPQAQGERGQRSERQSRERGQRSNVTEIQQLKAATMVDILPLLSHVQQQWKDNPIASITINKPNTIEAQIEFRATHAESLIRSNSTPSLKFNAVTGELIASDAQHPIIVPSAIYTVVTWLHMARGVDSVLRWLLFLSGVLGTMMIATGVVLWVVKRTPDVQKLGYKPFGHRVVEVLNVAAIVGLPIACAAYFTANRFIPAHIAERSPIEIKVFFMVWLLSFIHSAIRPHRHAWLEQLALAAAMFFILPILNFATGGRALWSSIYHGQWMVASFDLICLILGAIFLYGYYKLKRHQGLPVKAKKVNQTTSTQEQN